MEGVVGVTDTKHVNGDDGNSLSHGQLDESLSLGEVDLFSSVSGSDLFLFSPGDDEEGFLLHQGQFGVFAARVDASRPERDFPHDGDLEENRSRQRPHSISLDEVGHDLGENPVHEGAKIRVAPMGEGAKDKLGIRLGFGLDEFGWEGLGKAEVQIASHDFGGIKPILAESSPGTPLCCFSGSPQSTRRQQPEGSVCHQDVDPGSKRIQQDANVDGEDEAQKSGLHPKGLKFQSQGRVGVCGR